MRRTVTNAIRTVLDDYLPPMVRESFVFGKLTKIWLGSTSLEDFKFRAFRMSDREFSAACSAVSGLYSNRPVDTTDRELTWILDRIPRNGAARILEIGPGAGKLSRLLREAGCKLTTLDVAPLGCDEQSVIGVLERMPFADKSFDVVIASHVIEHVRSITRACLELGRVSRGRVLIVTPQQRYYRYTFDYHLQFFYSLDHLGSHMTSGSTSGAVIDRDLCLDWDVNAQSN